MKNKHLIKVLIGFCGMIILGLISLVVIDSMQNKDKGAKDSQACVNSSKC